MERDLVKAGVWPLRLLQIAAYLPYQICKDGSLNTKSNCQPLLLWSLICLIFSFWSVIIYYGNKDKFDLNRSSVELATDSTVQRTVSVAFIFFNKYVIIFPFIHRKRIAKFWSNLIAAVGSVVEDFPPGRTAFLEHMEKVQKWTRRCAFVVLFLPVASHTVTVISATLGEINEDLLLRWQNSSLFERTKFGFASVVWIQETFFHGALALWLSYLIHVQAICLQLISMKLSKVAGARQHGEVRKTLMKSVKDFGQLEELSQEFSKLYDHILLLDFFYNGIMSTYFAYYFLNMLLEGNRIVYTFSLVSFVIVGHRLYCVSSACSSFQIAAAGVQQNLLVIRGFAALQSSEIAEQVHSTKVG